MRSQLIAGAIFSSIAGLAMAQSDNSRLQGQVEMAVWLSPALQTADLTVTVDDGEVVLGGTVGSSQARELAMDISRSLPGVNSVSDDTELERGSRAGISGSSSMGNALKVWREAHIRTELNAEYESSPALETYEIDFMLDGETLVLTGSVGTDIERTVASQLAQRIQYVRVVNNRLTVDERPEELNSLNGEAGE